MYLIASPTVVIFSASSSGISTPNSSSSAITSSTVSRESAPKSFTKEDSFLTSDSFTPSCSATIFLTRCSLDIPDSPTLIKVQKAQAFYQTCAEFQNNTLLHIHSTVHMQRDSGDVSCARTGQESHGSSDVRRLAKAFQRYVFDQFGALLFAQGVRHVCVNEAGRDTVYGDIAAANLLRQ